MIPILRALWAEIVTPSKPDEPAYTVMLIAIAHAVLGASLAAIDLGAALAVTGDLLHPIAPGERTCSEKASAAVDFINQRFGEGTIRLGINAPHPGFFERG